MKALLVGRPYSRVAWYRCVLPAMYGGWDWATIDGPPPGLTLVASWIGGATVQPDFLEYDVVVFQQVRGLKWMNLIRKIRDRGVVVLYEIDDYVHELSKTADHDFSRHYQKHDLKSIELCMRACDGVIFSTKFLKDEYSKYARSSYLCENGLDMGRYRLTKPPRGEVGGRETVTVMWSGATGHQTATIPWIVSVADVMRRHSYVSFVSVGQDFAELLKREFPGRSLGVPFTGLENYPAAMMMGDVEIAPAGDSKWYRAKSDLRVMEAAALGIPVVADRKYKHSVVEGETGYLIGPGRAAETYINRLVEDDQLRHDMSAAAKQHAVDNFDMAKKVDQWERAFEDALSSK